MSKCCPNTSIEINTPAPLIEGQPSSVPCTTPCTPEPSTCQTSTCVPQGLPMSSCSPCSPQPYYANTSMCAENNKQVQTIIKWSSTLKSLSAFAMPSCGARVRVIFNNVVDVPVGSWIWAYAIGYLEVISVNPYTGEIEVSNPCPEGCGQSPVGTPVPACTLFVVTTPLCPSAASGPDSIFPFLAADFTAPADGDCLLISVTNVNGLVVGKNVAITTGTYRIDSIDSPTTITICNDGAGLPAGTIVHALDGAGNLIVPIVLIDSNPCTFPDILCGKVLACSAGVAQPLIGSEDGQILVWDDGEECASFRTLGIPVLDCTSLTTCLTLDPDLPAGTAYLVEVVSTADFVVGQLVLILGRVFEVTDILNATQMRLQPQPDPVVVETYPVNSQVCSADCCTQLEADIADLQSQIDTLDELVEELRSQTNGASVTGLTAVDITTIGTDALVQTCPQLVINNTSDLHNMDYLIVCNFSLFVNVETVGVWAFVAQVDEDGGGAVDFATSSWGAYPGLTGTTWVMSATARGFIPPNTNKTFDFTTRVRTLATASAPSVTVSGSIGLGALCVAA